MKQYIETNKDRFFDELFSLLRIPSVSSVKEHQPDMQKCAQKLVQLLMGGFTPPLTEPYIVLPMTGVLAGASS